MSQTLVLRVDADAQVLDVLDRYAIACSRWMNSCFRALYAGRRNNTSAREVFWRDEAGEMGRRWRVDRKAAYHFFVAKRPFRSDIRLAKALQGLLTKVDGAWQNFNNPKLPRPHERLPRFRPVAHFANQEARLKLERGDYVLTLPNPLEKGKGRMAVKLFPSEHRDYQARMERLVQDLARRGAQNTPSMEFIRHDDGNYYVHVPIEAPAGTATGNALAGVDVGIINTAGFAIVSEAGAETSRVSAGAMRHRFERLHARRRQLRRKIDQNSGKARRCRTCRGSGSRGGALCQTCAGRGYRLNLGGNRVTSEGKWWPKNRNAKRAHERLKGKVARTNTTVAHQISRLLVDECRRKGVRLIGLEDLRQMPPPRAQRAYNRRATQWNRAEFRDMIVYKARWAGIETHEVDERGTTIRCSKCSFESRKNIDSRRTRRFACQSCGFEADRDENAAVNIAVRADRYKRKVCFDCGGSSDYSKRKFRCDDCAHRRSLSYPAGRGAGKDSRRGGRKAGSSRREGSSPDEGDGSGSPANDRARRKTPTIGAAAQASQEAQAAVTSRTTTTLDASTGRTYPKIVHKMTQTTNERRGAARAPQEPSRASGQSDEAAGSRPKVPRRRGARKASAESI